MGVPHGQFLRLRREKTPANPTELLRERVLMAEQDIKRARMLGWQLQSPAVAILGDARALPDPPLKGQPNLVITSPPYVNRYDYTRSYSLELCFAFVKNFDELRSLRHSVSQQMGRYGRVPVRESVLVWGKGNARSAYHPTPVRPHQQYCCRISDSIDRIADLIDGIANPIDKIADPDDGIADPIDSTADPIDGIANSIDRIGNPDGVCKGVVPA
jgi:hypothetical protein